LFSPSRDMKAPLLKADLMISPSNMSRNDKGFNWLHENESATSEAMLMSGDEDTFFEDDEFDEEDEEEEEEYEDEEEYEEDEYLGEDELPRAGFRERVAGFIEDPWPKTVFFLMLVGFGMVLLTPPNVWSLYRYAIFGVYFLVVLASVGAVYAMVTWIRAGADKLRFAGITNMAVVLLAAVIGFLDTAFWIAFGVSVIPGYSASLLFICYILVAFSLYSLWMIQKSLNPQQQPRR
jgi:hypothetical protein